MRKLPLFVMLACAMPAAIALVLAPGAGAASTVAITVGSDPVESITTQLGVSGASTEPESRASLKVKPGGGRGCAANNEADEGSSVIGSFQGYLASPGPFTDANNWTFEAAGSYLACAWLEGPSGSVVATASLTVAIRPPHLALSIRVPRTVSPGRTFQVAMTVQAETERELYDYLLPANGRGCPANAEAAQSTAGEIGIHSFGVNVDGGPRTVTDNESLTTLGVYLACAYIEYPSSSSVPEAVASAAVTVATPHPPCVVPSLGGDRGIGAVERRIKSAHCAVGALRYTHSSRYRRGTVIGLSPRPGTRLAFHAAVGIVVSSGRPPRHRRHKRH